LIARRLDEIQEQEERKSAADDFEQIIQRSKQRDQVLLSTTRKQEQERPSETPRYDGSGVLRRSSVTLDGKPAYILASPQGGIRYYITSAPGVDLQKYLNQIVAVRGPITYRMEVRAQYIVVRDLTPIDMRGSRDSLQR